MSLTATAAAESFILRTSAGAPIMSYESHDAALSALRRRQQHYSRPLAIYRQRIIEERVL